MAQPTKKRGVKAAFANLPPAYRNAVKGFPVTKAVDRIASDHNLSKRKAATLDSEVTYLLLLIEDTSDFMIRLEKRLGISEQAVAEITESVTDRILRPIAEKMESTDEEMPVPPPPPKPDNNTPQQGYGGNTDPYREPVEE